MIKKVEIRPKSSILGIFAHLNYKAWYAIAEFVDNSIQSYLDNQVELRRLHGDAFKLKIRVWLDEQNKKIEISDNAAGISVKNFERAFRAAEVPIDRAGLSEFGMGMKTAACWFSRMWRVRTSALGENVEREVVFDLSTVIGDELQEVDVIEHPKATDDHYTVITLEDLGDKFPKTRTHSKIEQHLASIYRKYIEREDIELYFDESEVPLTFTQPRILQAPPQWEPDGEPIVWRKDLSFKLKSDREIVGFLAIREQGSTRDAGLSLFRRDRLIVGSDDDTYRPPEIFKGSNSFRYQRIFGELTLKGFEVSHTKDGFNWSDEDEQEMLELIEKEASNEPNLLRQADDYRKKPTRDEAVANSTEAFQNAMQVLEPIVNEIESETHAAISITESEVNEKKTDERRIQLNWANKSYTAILTPAFGLNSDDLLQLVPSQDPSTLRINISVDHPFITQSCPDSMTMNLMYQLVARLGLAAHYSNTQSYDSTKLLYAFNRLLRAKPTGK